MTSWLARWGTGAGVLLLALAFALGTPMSSAPDEPSHLLRAASVVRGQVLGPSRTFTSGGGYVGSYEVVTVPTGWGDLRYQHVCYRGDATVDASCAPTLAEQPGAVESATAAGRYPPYWYALLGAPSLVLDVGPATLAARIVGAAAAALLAAGAVVVARPRRTTEADGWAQAGVLAALTPVIVWLAGTANPSGVEAVAAIALWAAAVRLASDGPSRPAVGVAVAAAVVLAIARPVGPLWVVGVLVASALAFGHRATGRALVRDAATRGGLAVTLLAIVMSAGWSLYADAGGALGGVPVDATASEIARSSLAQTADRLHGMVGTFGWLDTPAPSWVIGAVGLLVVALSAAALVAGSWRQRTVLTATVLGVVFIPVVAELIAADDVGRFWQGRYTLPVGVGVPVVAGAVLARRARADGWAWARAAAVVVSATSLASLVTVVHRYASGVGTPLIDGLRDPAWTPPLGIAVPLVLGAAGALLVIGGASTGRPTRVAPAADSRATPTLVSRTD